ncbi:MAG: lipid-A-disaccharide synthase [Melioribacteraceae bacterium]|nr:lipid-A-disaccharide synthase [Melioribacteraceae bacterium]
MNKEYLIIAGESSGDLHGSALMKEMLDQNKDLSFFGVGGNNMIDAGLTNIYHNKDLAFLGFAEVVKHIPFIKKVQKEIIEECKKRKITSAILIDYPGFNLGLAKKLHKIGVKIFYYISPQIWAWGGKRIHKIKKLVDKMIVVFPFEKELYENAGVDVEFVGHPLIERINEYKFTKKEEFFAVNGLNKTKEILLVMPGSREQEIEKIFPAAINAAKNLSRKFDLQIVVACASNIDEQKLLTLGGNSDFSVIKDSTYELLKYSKFGIIKSGTSTMEAGIFELPCVVVYVTSKLSYAIGKRLVKIDHIAMANIILGERVVDELLQEEVTENNIVKCSEKVLLDKSLYDQTKHKLSGIRKILGNKNASFEAASLILNVDGKK